VTQPPRVGRPCIALRKDGRPCRQMAVNGRKEQLCTYHAGARLPRASSRRNLQHGYYAQDDGGKLEYLRRMRPTQIVRGGGLAAGPGSPAGIREREMDLHPLDPDESDGNVAIAGLLHKMEMLDALIFRAEEHGLDITTLLDLYLQAASRLGRLIVERERASRYEVGDLLRLLEKANAQLER